MKGFANLLHVTRHPYIRGVAFYTQGPKPDHCYFWRQGNGMTILMQDKKTPVGWVDFDVSRGDTVIILPLTITLSIWPPRDDTPSP